jgi:hypothetical protein
MSSVVTIACPSCGHQMQVSSDALGEKVQCQGCGHRYAVSPVFMVMDGQARRRPPAASPARSVVRVAAVALIAAGAALAVWVMRRPGPDAPAPADPPPAPDAVASRPAVEETVWTAPPPPAETPADPVPPPAAPAPDPTPPPPAAPAPALPAAPPDPPAPEVKPAPPPPTPPAPPVARLKADRLWDAFDLDPAQAKAQYAGQPVEVVARGRVERDEQGQAYFGARVIWPAPDAAAPRPRSTPQRQTWEREGYPASVRCYLPADQVPAAEALPPDREHILRGVVQGRHDDPAVYMGYVVVLRDCRVVR